MNPIDILKESGFVQRDWYLDKYPDVGLLGMHPAEHYYLIGAKLGRNPGVKFNTEFYISQYPDVAESGMNPLLHYLLHGVNEGRFTRENNLALLDYKLWSGHAPSAIAALERIVEHERTPHGERYEAAWSLACWRSFSAEHEEALALALQMAVLLPHQRLEKRRVLLEANCRIQLQQLPEAAAILNEFLATHKGDTDAQLLLANTFTDDTQRLACINQMFLEHGFLPITKKPEHHALSFASLSAEFSVADCCIAPSEQYEKISIIMPIYCAEDHIEIAIDSLLNQTWRNIELIAVDDCSPDNTVEVLERIAARDTRVKVIKQPVNKGAYAARNRGLEAASGDFITTHDADDWSHPQKLEQQMRLFRQYPAAQGVILSWVRATKDLQFTINWRPSDSIIHYSHSSFMLRREAIAAIGQWDEVRISADTELIWRAQHKFGKDAILHDLAHVPMAIALDDESSLTRTKATHVSTVYFGLRQVYRELSRWYHQQGLDPTKKTCIPQAMLHNRKDIQAFDIAIIADFFSVRHTGVVEQLIRAAASNGQRVALLHWPSFKVRQHKFSDTYCQLVHEGLAQPIVFGDNVEVRQIVVSDFELLLYPVVAVPNFSKLSQITLYDRGRLPAGPYFDSLLEQAKQQALTQLCHDDEINVVEVQVEEKHEIRN